jgi:hypothetical protein
VPAAPLSVANLEELDRTSPAPSTSLVIPDTTASGPATTSPWDPYRGAPTAPIDIPRYPGPNSTRGSVGSIGSMLSVASYKSVDCRGPRKGRKGWTDPGYTDYALKYVTERNKLDDTEHASPEQNHAPVDSGLHLQGWSAYIANQPPPEPTPDISSTALGPADHNPLLGAHEVDQSLPYVCTWPDCSKRFANRSGWERHEEALHYNPTHWICCSDQNLDVVIEDCLMCLDKKVTIRHLVEQHFSACAKRHVNDRTFFRKDQLKQHVRRHVSLAKNWPPIPDNLLQAWKSDNPMLDAAALQCGFCAKRFEAWKERTDHVAEHLSLGLWSKLDWLPQLVYEEL